MRALIKVLTSLVMAEVLLIAVPAASAQKAKPMPPQPAPAPMTQQTGQQQVLVVEPIRVLDPFFAYPYPYAYPPDYMAANLGYVKIKTDRKDASVYVDGGFADKVEKAKKFALRPGNHVIELCDSDGRSLYKELWHSRRGARTFDPKLINVCLLRLFGYVKQDADAGEGDEQR